jgi:hypothetical protein
MRSRSILLRISVSFLFRSCSGRRSLAIKKQGKRGRGVQGGRSTVMMVGDHSCTRGTGGFVLVGDQGGEGNNSKQLESERNELVVWIWKRSRCDRYAPSLTGCVRWLRSEAEEQGTAGSGAATKGI